jgi:hypothetical protein
MNKKTFQTAPRPKPQPTADEIAAFERSGSGHDAAVQNVGSPKPANVANAEPTKRLSLDVPQSMHVRFKTACSATGRKMVGEVMTFIERRTAELEEEAGISRK